MSLRRNLESLGLAPPVAVVRALRALPALRLAATAGETYDLVLIDPPYGAAAALSNTLPEALKPVLADDARIITESDRRLPLARPPNRLRAPLRRHPHPHPEMTRPDKRIAVCPGSYDPLTFGHLDVIRRAAAHFDEVVVGVVAVSTRKRPLFTVEERISFINDSTADLPHVRAEPFSVLVVDFARAIGAGTIVKGLRAISDFEYEFEMNQLNRGCRRRTSTPST